MKRILLAILLLLPTSLYSQNTAGTARRIRWLSSAPALCSPLYGDVYVNTTSKTLWLCTATNTWTQLKLVTVTNLDTVVALSEASDAVVFNMALGNVFTLTPTDDGDAFTLSNPTGCTAGQKILLKVTNNATAAGETITLGGNYTTLGEVGTVALSTGNSDKTYIGMVCTSATAADIVSLIRTTAP